MGFFEESIKNIVFEDKFTDDEERFGIYRVPTNSGCIEFVKLYKGEPYKPHIHDKSSAEFVFFCGKGELIIGDKEIPYKAGDKYSAAAGVKHGFIVEEDTIFLSVQSHPIQNRDTGEIDIRYE